MHARAKIISLYMSGLMIEVIRDRFLSKILVRVDLFIHARAKIISLYVRAYDRSNQRQISVNNTCTC